MRRSHPLRLRLSRRGAGAIGGVCALIGAVVTLVYALSRTDELWPWLLLPTLVFLAGVGAHFARRKR